MLFPLYMSLKIRIYKNLKRIINLTFTKDTAKLLRYNYILTQNTDKRLSTALQKKINDIGKYINLYSQRHRLVFLNSVYYYYKND